MPPVNDLLFALLLGMMGSAHCVGMCGGIIGALSSAIDSKHYKTLITLCYNFGRMISYVVIAIVFHVLIHAPMRYFSLDFLRPVSGFLIIVVGLYFTGWWRGIVYLEKIGALAWKHIQPLSQSLFPVDTPLKGFLLGLAWGWLPCGLIYTALVYAATSDTVSGSALIMLSFAVGTLPAVVLTGILAERFIQPLRSRRFRTVLGVFVILLGIWTTYASLSHRHDHHAHEPSINTSIRSQNLHSHHDQ